ncbi:molybdate ABC transporter permease subunit [Algiphilus sp.]|uniref:molybdate ABC transporter permease subunit n=1 Tax=Algiphilus sp. TaxID=1872431 RepID=UPI0025BE5AE8|nr:molybdate ABC transporter permease subunit [Algiphilus sp.]
MNPVLQPEEWTALLLSLRVSFWAVALSLPIGIAVAWLLARRDFVGKSLLDALVHLPLILPPVVTGYLLLVVFGRQGVVGGWLHEWLGITLAFRWTGAVLAGAIVGFPLMVRAVRLSIEAVDRRLEGAAMVLGARPLRVFLTVTLPLASPGIIAGALLAFARALGEFGATITFVSNIPGETRTLPIAIYTYLQIPGGEGAAGRLVLLSVVLALAALLASEWLARSMRRRLEAG